MMGVLRFFLATGHSGGDHVDQQLTFCLVLKEVTPRQVFISVTTVVILVADFVVSTAPTPAGHESWRTL